MQNRIPPPLLALALLLAMWLTAPPHPAPQWSIVLAVGLFIAAGAFGLPALHAFRRAGTTIDPVRIGRATSLVTGGVYRFSRNPMYLSLALLLSAWAMWLGGAWVWAGPVFLVLWLDQLQIRPEERAMTARFGEDYLRYRAKVRRWL